MNDHAPMEAWKVNLLTLLALLTLALVAIPVFSQKIEKDIELRAQDLLAAERVDWASVDAEGRDIVLVGEAPQQKALDEVVSRLEALPGVRMVEQGNTFVDENPTPFSDADTTASVEKPAEADTGQVEAVAPISHVLLASYDGNAVKVHGTAADEAMRDRLQDHVKQVFGADSVSGDWILGGAPPEGWETAVKTGFAQLTRLQGGELEIKGTEVRLSGQAELKAVSDSVNQQMQVLMDDGYSLAYLVDVELPDATTCQMLFVELLQGHSIHFQVGHAEVLEDSIPLLERLAGIAEQCTDYAIQVSGHTDATGGAARNQELSYARAQAVVDWLAARGVDVSQMTAVGHGERYPIADNNTESGRATNRRIEITVKGS